MSVSLSVMPFYLAPSWHPKTEAANLLASFLQQQGGKFEVRALKSLYDDNPNLKKLLGNLQSFCDKHPSFTYNRRSGDFPTMLSLRGHEHHVVPLRAESPVPLPVQAETEVGVDTEKYVPRWMSRKVLNSQCRSQPRSVPLGFRIRRRSQRRKRQQAWLQDFLEAFWPDIAHESGAMMAATRTCPCNDTCRTILTGGSMLRASMSDMRGDSLSKSPRADGTLSSLGGSLQSRPVTCISASNGKGDLFSESPSPLSTL